MCPAVGAPIRRSSFTQDQVSRLWHCVKEEVETVLLAFMVDNQACKRIGWTALWALVLAGAAALMNLAQHSTDAHWLGWVTLVPLFLAIRNLSPARAALAGAFWGLSLCLFSTLGPDSGLPFSVRSLAFLTAVPALYALLGAVQTRRVGFSPLILGLGWVGVELALQPLSLRHGLLAATQDGELTLRVVGYVGGWFLVAFSVAYVNASLLEVLTAACGMIQSQRRPVFSRRRVVRVTLREVLLDSLSLHSPMIPRAPPAV
jgi:apolipoprotein N-acyltransferase